MDKDFFIDNLYLLAENEKIVTKQTIDMFANSNLPNSYFVKQFTDIGQQPFCDKKYWRSFSRILIARGANALTDVYRQMLMWLQDINWPGSVEIANFVCQNFDAFCTAARRCVDQALQASDDAWLNCLLLTACKSRNFSVEQQREIFKKVDLFLTQPNGTNLIQEIADTLFDKC